MITNHFRWYYKEHIWMLGHNELNIDDVEFLVLAAMPFPGTQLGAILGLPGLDVDDLVMIMVDDVLVFDVPLLMVVPIIGLHTETSICEKVKLINSPPPSAAYMRRWNGSALVQVMACRLSGAKPLPEPMLPYCQLDPWEQTSVKVEST